MQATQSSNASGKRGLTSPFAAPIEAARRYLDRQRSERPAEDAPGLPERLTGSTLTDGSELDQNSDLDQDHDEYSRAWYDHSSHPVSRGGPRAVSSSEKGPDFDERALFEPPLTGYGATDWDGDREQITGQTASPITGRTAGQAREDEMEQEERGPVFTFEPAIAAPDPNEVRAAIFRLSRESKLPSSKVAGRFPDRPARTGSDLAGLRDPAGLVQAERSQAASSDRSARSDGDRQGTKQAVSKQAVSKLAPLKEDLVAASGTQDWSAYLASTASKESEIETGSFEGPSAPHAGKPQSSDANGFQQTVFRADDAFAGTAPAAFADVARQVWGPEVPFPDHGPWPVESVYAAAEWDALKWDAPSTPVGDAPREDISSRDPFREAAEPLLESRLNLGRHPGAATPVASCAKVEVVTDLASPKRNPLRTVTGAAQVHAPGIHAPEIKAPGKTAAQDYPGPRQSSVSEATVARGPAGPSTSPALAHDAKNLLSALRLYSELLSFTGVLRTPHLHYAEDLKLLAKRVEGLIERLLELHAAASERAFSPVGEAPGLALAQGADGPAQAADSDRAVSEAPEPDCAIDAGHEAGRLRPAGWSDGSASSRQTSGAEVLPRAQGTLANPIISSEMTSSETIFSEMISSRQTRDLTDIHASYLGANHFDEPDDSTQGRQAEAAPPKSSPEEELGGTSSGLAEVPRVNLVDLLLRWGSLLSTLADGALEVRFGPQASTPIAVDAEALERILVNLVQNAAAATRNGGAIRIGAGVEERKWPMPQQTFLCRDIMVLTVDDSGNGMTAEQVDRALGRGTNRETGQEAGREEDVRAPILHDVARSRHQTQTEGFVSGYGSWPGCEFAVQEAAATDRKDSSDGEDTARLGSGTGLPGRSRHGLGLTIVRQLVEASGGTLSIHSKPGLGTRIEMHWPVLDAIAAERASGADTAGAALTVSGGPAVFPFSAPSSQFDPSGRHGRPGQPGRPGQCAEEQVRATGQRVLPVRPVPSDKTASAGLAKRIADREGAIAC